MSTGEADIISEPKEVISVRTTERVFETLISNDVIFPINLCILYLPSVCAGILSFLFLGRIFSSFFFYVNLPKG